MEVRLAHMISLNLRPVKLAAYNSYRYASHLTGNDPEEVVIEDWLSLTNPKVSEIILEAVRPRTKEQHSQEMAENFARTLLWPSHRFLKFNAPSTCP